MRLQSVEIINYRQYRHSKYDFQKKGDYDLHIALGGTGTGKTNLLNAISWCLYGDQPHLGDESKAERILNSPVFEELKIKGEPKGQIKIIVTIESAGSIVRFTRTQDFIIATNFPDAISFLVQVKSIDSKDWKSFSDEEETMLMVNKYVPINIRNYIFFDGELLENYFTKEESINIKKSVKVLSQVNLLDDAESHLKTILTDYNNKVEEANPDLKPFNRQHCFIEEQIKAAEKTVNFMVSQKDAAENEISKYNKIINNAENLPDKIDEYNELNKKLDILEEKKKQNQSDIFKLVRDYYPILVSYKFIQPYHSVIKEKEKNGELPPKIDPDFLNTMLQDGKCGLCNEELNSYGRKSINNILDKLSISSELSHRLTRDDSAIKHIYKEISNYKNLSKKILQENTETGKDIKACNESIVKLEKYIKQFPDTTMIMDAHSKRKELKAAYDEYVIRISNEEKNIKELNNQLIEIDKKISDIIKKQKGMDALKNRISFIKECINILKETSKEILDECREEMKNTTFDLFSKLLWKKDKFANIEIEEDFAFNVYDVFSEQCIGSCSKGELALLAIAFTLSLQKASGHESLLFIDTPIGRIDDENRINFMEALCEVAKQKQVILTFTTSEFSQQVRTAIHGKISTLQEIKLENNCVNLK